MSMGYVEAEGKLVNLMNQPGVQIELWDGTRAEIMYATKPYTGSGECKTDCFVMCKTIDNGEEFPIKISYKSESAQFVENKLSMHRAEEIFGSMWQEIIYNAIRDMWSNVKERPVVYFSGARQGSFTLGWRCDLLYNNPSGKLVTNVFTSRRAKLEMFSGVNLPPILRDASVNGIRIPDSGIADWFLMRDLFDFNEGDPNVPQEIISCLCPIDDEEVDVLPEIYIALKAVNYRSFENKYDGNRPLAVLCEWFVDSEGKLCNNLIFGDEVGGEPPLSYGADYSYSMLESAMNEIGILTTDDLNENNLADRVNYRM